MKHSHGFYSKHSRHLLARKRKGISKLLAEFQVGSPVLIRVDPRERGKIPLRFNGRTAKVVMRQGKGYVIEFRDLNAIKRLVVSAAHLETA